MIVSQFRTFADLFGETPLMVGETQPTTWVTESGESIGTSRGFVSVANRQTGKTVTIYPVQNTMQAVVTAVQSGQTVQKATAVNTANQSLFSQTIQKLLDSSTKVHGTPARPKFEPPGIGYFPPKTTQTTPSGVSVERKTSSPLSDIIGIVRKYWLWIVLAVVAAIALAVIL
ncbi:MAG: hypothetical protein RXR82_06325 [Nitrososphaeria archaeon]